MMLVFLLVLAVLGVVTGLGNGEYYEMWGYSPAQIRELDYGEDLLLDDKVRVIFTPASIFPEDFLRRIRPSQDLSSLLRTGSDFFTAVTAAMESILRRSEKNTDLLIWR